VEKVKQELAAAGVLLEGYGGSVTWHAISAKTGEGVSELLDLILLATDLLELSWDRKAPASGVVLSSRLDARRGVVAGVVVTNGMLRQGAPIATETARGKVKLLENFLGKPVKELPPSAPALVGGFEVPPEAGETFIAGEEAAIGTLHKGKVVRTETTKEREGTPLILKADEMGSLAALGAVVAKVCAEVPCRIVDKSIGNIYESDVKLAEGVGAAIIGFRIKADRAAENLAEGKKVTIVTAPVIYDLEKFLREKFGGVKKKETATLHILATFGKGKTSTSARGSGGMQEEQIVGGRIAEGTVANRALFTVTRNGRTVGEGQVVNLQAKRQNVSEAAAGTEVGLLVECSVIIEKGDTLTFTS
jgi:translation initiation factor IF-2